MSQLREIAGEMIEDLPQAILTAAAVGSFVAMVVFWSGWLAGALP